MVETLYVNVPTVIRMESAGKMVDQSFPAYHFTSTGYMYFYNRGSVVTGPSGDELIHYLGKKPAAGLGGGVILLVLLALVFMGGMGGSK